MMDRRCTLVHTFFFPMYGEYEKNESWMGIGWGWRRGGRIGEGEKKVEHGPCVHEARGHDSKEILSLSPSCLAPSFFNVLRPP